MILVGKLMTLKGKRDKRCKNIKLEQDLSVQCIVIDIAGPYPETTRKNYYILVINDYFSKLVEIYPLLNILYRLKLWRMLHSEDG